MTSSSKLAIPIPCRKIKSMLALLSSSPKELCAIQQRTRILGHQMTCQMEALKKVEGLHEIEAVTPQVHIRKFEKKIVNRSFPLYFWNVLEIYNFEIKILKIILTIFFKLAVQIFRSGILFPASMRYE